ncbi:putative ATPase [Kribbella amoyensis]|uniref:Putative ATPase n=1 Tax=Kribbella amoyensis TaxID=996641 RepID=A0A561BJX2_9ACTN|nr:BTAD domain-containing putative transcriptional regulator [Kribbella amoyensis]TWD79161.1 putative ATPase [Kribbella amoyensis]
MRFGVLGPVTAWTDTGEPVRIPELKVRAVLADLLAHRGRIVSADRLTEDLYADAPPANPAGTVQLKISRLRHALDHAEPGARSLVVSRSPGYLLTTEAVDADEFLDLVRRARVAAAPRERVRLLREALGLWRGPAYADFADETFTRSAILRLEEERLSAEEELAEARLELGEHHQLAAELTEQVTLHPLRQRLRAAYLLALYRSGRHADALAGYDELRHQLAEDLGLDPTPELAALHTAILRQDPALTLTPRGTNLPAGLTELIGRESVLDKVSAGLKRGRLVTLVGPGGTGKTRVALAAASEQEDAWLVELAALDRTADPETIAATALTSLGIREPSDRRTSREPGPHGQAERLLVEALRGRQMVLLLDNCEHVADAAAQLAETVLRAAPGVRVLATGQQVLGVPGEVVIAVPPLGLPVDDEPLTASAAVQLFTARAGLTVTDQNATAIRRICLGLDGNPLALELAAARVRVLGVGELAARLDDRLALLSSGRRTGPARQQTLRAMIDWSWQLLSPAEQTVLRRLATHADSFSLDAAVSVAQDNDAVNDAINGDHDVAAAVLGLADRSLVTTLETSTGQRFRLLESVRAFAAEQLEESGEAESVQRRHLAYYLDLAARAQLHSADQLSWLDRLDAETAEFRHAFDHAVSTADGAHALRLASSLGWYWFLRGRLIEARRTLATALTLPGPATDRAAVEVWQTALALLCGETPSNPSVNGQIRADQLRASVVGTREAVSTVDLRAAADAARLGIADPVEAARAVWLLAYANRGFGDPATTEELVATALRASRELADDWGVAASLSLRATLRRARSELAAAERDAHEAERIFRRLGDRWGLLKATSTRAELAEIEGDYPSAAEHHRTGRRLAEDLGRWCEVSFKLSGLGRIALLTGDTAAADDLHHRALRIAVEQSDEVAEEFAEMGLALSARRQHRLDDAERHLRRWLHWLTRVDGEPGLALVLAELGFVAELRGDPEIALARHRDSQAAAEKLGDPRAIALALEGQAGAHSSAGRLHQARRLLAEAAALRTSVGAPLPPAERGDLDRITARLG